MKKYFAMLALIAAPAFAQSSEDVSVALVEEGVEITVQAWVNNGCTSLTIEDATVEASEIPSFTGDNGRISLTTGVKRPGLGEFCTMALRMSAASVVFERGETLPALTNGFWELNIDGKDYGYLQIASSWVKLTNLPIMPGLNPVLPLAD